MEVKSSSDLTIWHTVLPTSVGDLTLVRDPQALRGLYYPHHWYLPKQSTFGPRCDDGFDDVIRQLGEYLGGQRRDFDMSLVPRGDSLQQRVWAQVRDRHVRRPGQASWRQRDSAADRGGRGP